MLTFAGRISVHTDIFWSPLVQSAGVPMASQEGTASISILPAK